MHCPVWVILLSSVLLATPISGSTEECREAVTKALSSSDGEVGLKGLPPPDQPFKVIWNHPDNCERRGIHLNLDLYNFTFNRKREFLGEQIQTLYNKNTGRWPIISGRKEGSGGVPQLFNDKDFNATKDSLCRQRRDNFAGAGVIDFENWRPTFWHNFGKLSPYQKKSKELVKSQHPDYSQKKIDREACNQFNEAAKRIFKAKLAIAQTVMPGGYWGYYNYPRTWSDNVDVNSKRMGWLFRQATGLYPSIYYFQRREKGVADHVAEAVRIQHTLSPPNTGIFLYAYLDFDTKYLKNVFTLPADMGASGVVIWGSSGNYHNSDTCGKIQSFIARELGPFVKNLTQFMSDCSFTLCGGHGRCVRNDKDTVLDPSQSVHLSEQCSARESRFSRYHCRCYQPWTGPCCSPRVRQLDKSASTSAASVDSSDSAGAVLVLLPLVLLPLLSP